MSDKARITYRFDNKSAASRSGSAPGAKTDKQEPQKAEKEESKVVSLFQEDLNFTRELAPWNSPFQDDPNELEKLIRETDHDPGEPRQPAEKQKTPEIDLGDERKDPGSGGWYDGLNKGGDLRSTIWDEGSLERIRRVSTGPSWFKVFASVTGAIATGALFGYIVLSLFAGQSVWPSGDSNIAAPADSDSKQTVNQGEVQTPKDGYKQSEGMQQAPAEGAFVQAELPVQTYYMLQFGVFSSREGMDAAVEELKQRGLAAAAMTSGDFRVYTGIAGDRNQAKSLADQLAGTDVFVKTVETPSAAAVRYNGKAESFTEFIEQTARIIRLFNDLTIEQLEQTQTNPISNDSWRETHQQWTTAAAAVQSGIADEGKEDYNKLVRSISTVAVSLDEYGKKPSRTFLWTAQSALMEAVLAEKAWLEKIVAL